MPVNGYQHLFDSIQCRAGLNEVSLDRFTENHQISVGTGLDNGLFRGKEFVNVCRRHAQFLGNIRDRGFFEPELTKQLVGFDHDPLTGFIASPTFAGKLSGSERSDEKHYSSLFWPCQTKVLPFMPVNASLSNQVDRRRPVSVARKPWSAPRL